MSVFKHTHYTHTNEMRPSSCTSAYVYICVCTPNFCLSKVKLLKTTKSALSLWITHILLESALNTLFLHWRIKLSLYTTAYFVTFAETSPINNISCAQN